MAAPHETDDDLIPWEIAPGHRTAYPLAMLRLERQRRAGLAVRESDVRRLVAWRRTVDELNAVVLYDADSEDGFYLVPREACDGQDLVRRPNAAAE